MWLKSVVGVGKLINSVDLYILLDLVGVGDWKVGTVISVYISITVYVYIYIYIYPCPISPPCGEPLSKSLVYRVACIGNIIAYATQAGYFHVIVEQPDPLCTLRFLLDGKVRRFSCVMCFLRNFFFS